MASPSKKRRLASVVPKDEWSPVQTADVLRKIYAQTVDLKPSWSMPYYRVFEGDQKIANLCTTCNMVFSPISCEDIARHSRSCGGDSAALPLQPTDTQENAQAGHSRKRDKNTESTMPSVNKDKKREIAGNVGKRISLLNEVAKRVAELKLPVGFFENPKMMECFKEVAQLGYELGREASKENGQCSIKEVMETTIKNVISTEKTRIQLRDSIHASGFQRSCSLTIDASGRFAGLVIHKITAAWKFIHCSIGLRAFSGLQDIFDETTSVLQEFDVAKHLQATVCAGRQENLAAFPNTRSRVVPCLVTGLCSSYEAVLAEITVMSPNPQLKHLAELVDAVQKLHCFVHSLPKLKDFAKTFAAGSGNSRFFRLTLIKDFLNLPLEVVKTHIERDTVYETVFNAVATDRYELECFVRVLQPFADAVAVLGATDRPTLHLVVREVVKLRSHFEVLSKSKDTLEYALGVVASLEIDRAMTQLITPVHLKALLLDPTQKSRLPVLLGDTPKAQATLASFIEEVAGLPAGEASVTKNADQFQQLVAKVADKFPDGRCEATSYLRETVARDCGPDGSGEFDILGWWKVQGKEYPRLRQLARKCLSVPAAVVGFEPLFDHFNSLTADELASMPASSVDAAVVGRSVQKAGVK